MRWLKTTSLLLIILTLTIAPIMATWAADFDRDFIISDDQMFTSSAMTKDDIQQFLEMHHSYLAIYTGLSVDGQSMSAAEIINTAAQTHGINPQVILVMLQKEQSLIDESAPSNKQLDWAMGYGVCDSCSMNDPSLFLFQGFGTQVDRATQRLRWYKDNPQLFRQVGVPTKIDGYTVTPLNQATAALYSYTPHIHGNYLFWKLWQKWFHQYYPDGSLLQVAGEPGVWLIQYGLKRPILSRAALASRYNSRNIVRVSRAELEKYETGSPIRFPNYSLLRAPDAAIYLVVDDTIRHIDSMATFRSIGFNPEEVVDVTIADLEGYTAGTDITIADSYPMGALLQNNKTGAVFFVQAGVKHPLIAKEIMTINYPRHKITPVSPADLERYPEGAIIKFREGELLKSPSSPVVYVVAEGKKHPIANGKVFKQLGYQWANIKTVSETSLTVLPLGDSIDLLFKDSQP